MNIRSLIAFALTALPFAVRAQGEAPRLVVSIVVDQLRSDYLEAFMPLYGEGGFKRLMGEGRMYSQAQFPFTRPDRASATACIYAGCSPYRNGIVGERWMNRQTLRPVYCVDDDQCPGIMTEDQSSPRQISVSTLPDELKISTDGKSLVFSISPFRDMSILAGGHAANAALWIDDRTGQWCTSSYYKAMPAWASGLNSFSPIAELLETEWRPINDLVGNFNYATSRGMRQPFKYKLTGDRRFYDFKTSGLVNEEVGRMVSACLQASGVGNDAVTDMLAVGFYAGSFRHGNVNEQPIELQDIYVRLDSVISRMIDDVEKKVGRERVLFVLTSTGYCDEATPSLEAYNIPTGTFSMVRATSLLNMYLGAVYGNERWIETSFGSQIFLDNKLIEDKGININELSERCADILSRMSGVEDVYTSQRLALGAWTSGVKALRNSLNPKCSGDIILDIQPGWHVVNEDFGERQYERESYMAFPLMLYGASVEHGEVDTPVEVDRVAPTIARIIRIRAPNACSAAPMGVKN